MINVLLDYTETSEGQSRALGTLQQRSLPDSRNEI